MGTDAPPIHPLRIAPIDAPARIRAAKAAGGARGIEPYRVLFPDQGAVRHRRHRALDRAQAFGAPWPGMLHASLAMQASGSCAS